jgi:hypothetical protein
MLGKNVRRLPVNRVASEDLLDVASQDAILRCVRDHTPVQVSFSVGEDWPYGKPDLFTDSRQSSNLGLSNIVVGFPI